MMDMTILMYHRRCRHYYYINTTIRCCQVCGFPVELGYIITVKARVVGGGFSCPWVEATPITSILVSGMRFLPGDPLKRG